MKSDIIARAGRISGIPPSRDLDSIFVKTIVQCFLTNTLFREAAAIPALWQQHYQVRYLHANEASEGQRKAETNGNWKLMHAARKMIDPEVLKHLNSIVMKRVGRYDHANALTKFLFDAWDVLEIEIGMVDLGKYLEIRGWGDKFAVGYSRGFGAAFDQTTPYLLYKPSPPYLASLVNIRMRYTVSLLSSLNYRCKAHLSRLNIPLSQVGPRHDLKELCMHICDFMTTERYRTVDPPNFYDLHNLFPHFYLTSHKRSIPLSLVHIFVLIAQSFGIAAFPFRIPLHVLVHITVPDPEVDDFFVDVFGVPTIINLRDDIPAIRERQGIHGNSLMHYLSPSDTTTMLLGNDRFILSSFNLQPFTLFLVLTGTSQSVPHLMSQADPLDCATFITEVLIPSLSNIREVQNELRQASQQSLEEEASTTQEIKLRTPTNTTLGYVAEDNIKPLLSASDELLSQKCQGVRILPKLFTGVLTKTTTRSSNVRDAPVQYRRARFVLSLELATAYNTMGDAWLGGGESVYTWLPAKELSVGINY
ncbi:hypothetical protein C8R41DRAFT_921491 [Lentinula lateritia]|uniref:Protein SirB1 N-terminal domain-containing protein n=1 Tax=Lentinula lateritia TaxID=40482 RepID=A0ABQ8VF30_9AGAR|nr:hypothetical protein C8R41DRAFT_921491 [Lentinula lateritia]